MIFSFLLDMLPLSTEWCSLRFQKFSQFLFSQIVDLMELSLGNSKCFFYKEVPTPPLFDDHHHISSCCHPALELYVRAVRKLCWVVSFFTSKLLPALAIIYHFASFSFPSLAFLHSSLRFHYPSQITNLNESLSFYIHRATFVSKNCTHIFDSVSHLAKFVFVLLFSNLLRYSTFYPIHKDAKIASRSCRICFVKSKF